MSKKYFHSQKVIIAYATAVVIISLLVIAFVYNPLIGSLIKKRNELTYQQRRYHKNITEINNLETIEDENELLAKEVQHYSTIKVEKAASSILNSLLKVSNRSGVEFISIDPITITDKQEMKYIRLRAKTRSGFHEIATFISEIRRLQGLFVVEDIELKNEDAAAGTVISELEISVYVTTEDQQKYHE